MKNEEKLKFFDFEFDSVEKRKNSQVREKIKEEER